MLKRDKGVFCPQKEEKEGKKEEAMSFELKKQENIEERADKNHDFNTKTSISMTKKANYTFVKHFHGGGNDFHLLSSFPPHNKSAEKLYSPKNKKMRTYYKQVGLSLFFLLVVALDLCLPLANTTSFYARFKMKIGTNIEMKIEADKKDML